jgi:hypothetical protein
LTAQHVSSDIAYHQELLNCNYSFCPTQLYLVGHIYKICIMMRGSMNVKQFLGVVQWLALSKGLGVVQWLALSKSQPANTQSYSFDVLHC